MVAGTDLMATTIVCIWTYSLFFCLGFKRTGPFVVMIGHMIMQDVFTFMIIASVFLFAFAQTFVCMAGTCHTLFRLRD